MVYLNDDPDRAPRLNGTELAARERSCPCADRPTRGERAAWWALCAYFAAVAVAVAVLVCGFSGAVWAWTRALHS